METFLDDTLPSADEIAEHLASLDLIYLRTEAWVGLLRDIELDEALAAGQLVFTVLKDEVPF